MCREEIENILEILERNTPRDVPVKNFKCRKKQKGAKGSDLNRYILPSTSTESDPSDW